MSLPSNKLPQIQPGAPIPQQALVEPEPERGRGRQRERARPDDSTADTLERGRGRQARPERPGPPSQPLRPTAWVPAQREAVPPLPRPGIPGADKPIGVGESLAQLPLSAGNGALTAAQKVQIAELAERHAQRHRYSTLAMPLALSRRARTLHKDHLPAPFDKALAQSPISSSALLTQYGSGTCFTLAEDLIARLQQSLGIKSHAIVLDRAYLRMAMWPSLEHAEEEIVEEIYEHVQGVGHTDVAVPYEQDGERRVLILATGRDLAKSWPMQDEAVTAYLQGQDQRGTLVSHPHDLAVRALWGRSRMHLHDAHERLTLGIDLLQQVLFTSSRANEVMNARQVENSGPHAPQVQRTFSIEGMGRIIDPSRTGPLDENVKDCLRYLDIVRQAFSLTHAQQSDLIYLIDHRDDYLTQVVHPLALSLQKSYFARTSCVTLCDKMTDYFRLRPNFEAEQGLVRARVFIEQAAHDVQHKGGNQARALYEASEAVAIDVLQKLLPQLVHDLDDERTPWYALAHGLVGRLERHRLVTAQPTTRPDALGVSL